MKLLVSKSDTIKVEVYCYEQDGEVEATNLKSEIPKNTEHEVVEFVFRKPGYGDSTGIIRGSDFKVVGDDTSICPLSFQNNVLRTLLVDWDLKDEEGEKLPVNAANVSSLIPNVARAAVAGALEKISI